ncbi:acyl-CoA synthetase [Nocardioides baekrokdamisoli]|uniref:Acyl-CoA synthetase n=1 Tax=Nocardioides baekrokdamisoli TaxID=1804624 RepID=A0A3G9J1L6_9ACTN|nr:AMP-binding protein [Nocardioides baekrokdamisoli]BBH17438.1 acyl-CoA synthetase [Nocardioides baekrokdamisoli]
MSAPGRLRSQLWAARQLTRSGMLAPLRPDKYVQMAKVLRNYGPHATSGFALAAARRPDGVALIDELGSLTWRQLQDRADALAAGLSGLIEDGAPIAILCRNHRGFVDSLLASARVGSSALLLNTGFSGPQLLDVMRREQAGVLIYDDEFAGVVDAVAAGLPELKLVRAWIDGPGETPTVEGLITAHAGETPPVRRPGRIVLLTSGTTGTPKGASRSGGSTSELAAMLERIPWQAEQTVVVAAPTFHAWGFGQLVIAATMTCTVVMRRRFDPEATLALAQEHGAAGISVVPVMLERIIDLPPDVLDRYPLPALRFVSASGSRMRADAVVAFLRRFGPVVFNSYNATEAGQITVASPADLAEAPDTAGRAVTGTLLRILDDDGQVVAPGQVGRIAVRGASEFDGYTSGGSKASADGYMISGDLGRMDDHGRLFVVGRDDDMIVSGGENVYPSEVERAIADMDAVREVVVIGVDDEAFGQRLAAYVVLHDDVTVTADAVKAHVRDRLAGYKVPRDVIALDQLPRNASGKVVVRELPGVVS